MLSSPRNNFHLLEETCFWTWPRQLTINRFDVNHSCPCWPALCFEILPPSLVDFDWLSLRPQGIWETLHSLRSKSRVFLFKGRHQAFSSALSAGAFGGRFRWGASWGYRPPDLDKKLIIIEVTRCNAPKGRPKFYIAWLPVCMPSAVNSRMKGLGVAKSTQVQAAELRLRWAEH